MSFDHSVNAAMIAELLDAWSRRAAKIKAELSHSRYACGRASGMESCVEELREVIESAQSAPIAQPASHWAPDAASGLIDYLPEVVSDIQPAVTREHLTSMIERMQSDPMSDTKANRWLGYIQGVLACNGVPLDALKDHNKAFAQPAAEGGGRE